jgi:hypothetical protein
MPFWAEDDASVYWDSADLYERANGRLYISADFALPLDLDADDQTALASAFAHELTDEEHLPYKDPLAKLLTKSTISPPEPCPSDPRCPFLALSRAAAARFGAQECPVAEISSMLPDVAHFLPFADIEPRQRRLCVHTDVC